MKKIKEAGQVKSILKEEIMDILGDNEQEFDLMSPSIILVVGVNGGRQDNHNQQACLSVPESGKESSDGGRRYFPGGCY